MAPLGTGFTYQGQLKNSAGNPINGACDFRFRLWDNESAGNQIGMDSAAAGVNVDDGYFTAQVNTANEFQGVAFLYGQARWLEVAVKCNSEPAYTALTPRQPITAVPYATYATDAGGVLWSDIAEMPAGFADGVDNVGWSLTGNAGTIPGTNFIGTTDNQAFEVKVNNSRVLRLEPNDRCPNVIGGDNTNAIGNAIYGGAIAGGHANYVGGDFGAIGGGGFNSAGNKITDAYTTVGGGDHNTAIGFASTVPGGSGAVADHWGQMAYAGGDFGPAGSAQTSVYVMRKEVTGTTWLDLYLDGNDDLLTIAPGRSMSFDILIVARTEAGESAGYRVVGAIENVGGATAFIGTPAVTILGEDDSAWNIQVVADNTYDALRVQVLGNGEVIRWVATVQTSEVAW